MIRAVFCHKPPKTTPKSALLFAFALLAVSAPAAGPVEAGRMAEPANREASGLAASHRTSGLLWTHNDSGGAPVLFALEAGTGALRGRVRLAGVTNTDWEDLASFELDGQAWLLVADTGDNLAQRTEVMLHVLAEPDPAALRPGEEMIVHPAYTITFIYEDGARDCEAVAVDPRDRSVWLLSKRDVPARLYRLPLEPATPARPAAARFMGPVPHLRQPNLLQRLMQSPAGAMRAMPTGMDFRTDGSTAAILIYGDLLLFPRNPGASWTEALARPPKVLPGFDLPQAEGVCFSADGRRLWICSERDDRLLAYDLP